MSKKDETKIICGNCGKESDVLVGFDTIIPVSNYCSGCGKRLRQFSIKFIEKVRYGHPRFYELLDEIAELHSRKNYNYARDGEPLSNFYACEKFGLPAPWGCLTRMTDKDDRKAQVLLKQDTVGEDITQTSRDDSIYNLIFEILWKDFMQNKNAKKIIELFRDIKDLLQRGKK